MALGFLSITLRNLPMSQELDRVLRTEVILQSGVSAFQGGTLLYTGLELDPGMQTTGIQELGLSPFQAETLHRSHRMELELVLGIVSNTFISALLRKKCSSSCGRVIQSLDLGMAREVLLRAWTVMIQATLITRLR
jgi:hypothetical protein